MINLFSDTQTKPTAAMREAMMYAEVGDEQSGSDPTVNLLLEKTAGLLGKEAALFLPTGTMCNLVAVKTHTLPGQAVLLDRMAHIMRMETGGAAIASSVVLETLPSEFGQFTAQAVRDALLLPPSNYTPPPALLCVEQTHNFGGGSVWPLEELTAVCDAAREHDLAVHMDGARLFNGVVASGISAAEYSAVCDSVWVDFTKGLGAPMGAVLAGSSDFIEAARRYKHAFGGAMRQAGIAAAGCIYALDHHIERLQADHDNMQLLAAGLRQIPGIVVPDRVDTNILFFEMADGAGIDAAGFEAGMRERGVLLTRLGSRLRAVTHLDVSREEIERAIGAARLLMAAWQH
ncbi:MAG: threonine aldolase family protein [Candidatus Promineifilaceae bacterium]